MKYPYKVKHDGVWYMPGQDVPVGEPTVVQAPAVQEETKTAPKKTEIQRMNKSSLLETAKQNGVDANDEMTVAELKSVLIDHFGL